MATTWSYTWHNVIDWTHGIWYPMVFTQGIACDNAYILYWFFLICTLMEIYSREVYLVLSQILLSFHAIFRITMSKNF